MSDLYLVALVPMAESNQQLIDVELQKAVARTGVRNRLGAYVGRWGRAVDPGERLVGSTEIVESAFGVQKRLSRNQSKGGMTSSSVGLGAVLGAVSADQMHAELERVPEKAVSGWAKRWFGETVQWLRRKFMRDRPADHEPEPVPG